MGVWSIGFGNGYETNNVEEILEFCLKTYRGLALPPTDEDGIPLDTNALSDAAITAYHRYRRAQRKWQNKAL